MNYGNESITQYLFSDKFEYDPRETSIELRMRTRDPDGGVLVHSLGTEENEFSSLEVFVLNQIIDRRFIKDYV